MNKISLVTSLALITPFAFAQQAEDSVQDMSDPLAVYTQAGFGVTDQGINIKIGNSYDTGNPDTMAMNIIELKGIGGDSLGLEGNDSVNSLRFRNFNLDTINGRGAQVDMNWDFENNVGSASYSLMQALPAFGPVQLFPLAGIGLTIEDKVNENSAGYSVPSSFAVVGTYSKITITDKIWLNYNPMYMSTLNHNDKMSHLMDGFYHEFIASYQINPKQNIRAYGNYAATESNTDKNMEWRVEFNQQF